MNCIEVAKLAHAAADGELDLRSSVEMESHLGDCPACAQAFANVKKLKSAVATGATRYSAPDGLEQRIRKSLGVSHEVKKPNFRFDWSQWKLGLAMAGTATATALVTMMLMRGPGESLADDLAGDHVRSLMAGHLTDVASTDQHTVKPWFNGRLDFSPPVVDLAGKGFPLVGGRLDYVNGREAAALVYQRAKHVINLFVWPTAEASGTDSFRRSGFNLIGWHENGMMFWAVSDLNTEELREFARLFQDETAASTR